MIEVHTWEPAVNSGKPLFCLSEKSALLGSDEAAA
jgi:hypothetical protein